MITIQNITLDTSTNKKQFLKQRGLQSIIGITKVGKNVMATAVVNTSGDLVRTASVFLIETGADASCLLLSPKYIGSAGKHHLFLNEILPRR